MRDPLNCVVEAINAVNRYANELTPILHDFFRPHVGEKILKADGTFLARIQKVLPKFPTIVLPNIEFSTYRQSSAYTLGWSVKACRLRVTEFSCLYRETTVYVGDLKGDTLECLNLKGLEAVRRTDYTVADIQASIDAYRVAQKAADALRDAIPYQFTEYA